MNSSDTRVCTVCGLELPLSAYDINARGNLLKRRCRKCCVIKSNESFEKHKEKRIATRKTKIGKYNLNRKEKRHKLGISKNYIVRGPKTVNGVCPSKTKDYRKEYRLKNIEKIRLLKKKYKYNKKAAGKLTVNTIQLVYEDNIKKFGTLTCYLCKKPIDMQLKFFNKITSEHLEHKTPLSRGGTNDYENLGIACSRCNIRKKDKTVAEYKKYLNKKGVN